MNTIAAGFCWIIRHSETVPTDYALLLLTLATGTIVPVLLSSQHKAKRLSTDGRAPAALLTPLLTGALALFYACLAPKVLLAPLRDTPQSGFARYYIPAIHEIEGIERQGALIDP